MAQLLSLAANVVTGTTPAIGVDQSVLLLRFAYWMLVFVVVLLAVHRFRLGVNVARALAVGACVLALLRLIEAIAFGHWGGGNPQFLSQNDYGLGFSTFTPFATWLLIATRGWRRLFAAAGWLLLLIAVMGNGSRSSWITVAVGLCIVPMLWGLTHVRNFVTSLAAVILAAGVVAVVFWWAPAGYASRLSNARPTSGRYSVTSRMLRDGCWWRRVSSCLNRVRSLARALAHSLTVLLCSRFWQRWARLR